MARFSRFDEMIIGIISGKGEGKREREGGNSFVMHESSVRQIDLENASL